MRISVIIPIYNSIHKLEKCVDSVLCQTYTDFECILVDDGSYDGSGELCDKLANQDVRVKVIHKPNGGVGSSRNAGLLIAQGEWIVFVDSDDYLLQNHLESLLASTKAEIDFILCGFQEEGCNNALVHRYERSIYVGKSAIKKLMVSSDFLSHMTPWDKMFRKSIVDENHLRFDEKLPISEDRLFCYQYLLYTSGIATTQDITYIHDRSDKNSLSHKSHNYDILSYRYEFLSKATDDIINNFDFLPEETYRLWKYLWEIFVPVINSLYSVKGNIFKSVRQQKTYFDSSFNHTLYAKIQDVEAVCELMSNPKYQQILNKQFFRYDLSIFRNYVKARLGIK